MKIYSVLMLVTALQGCSMLGAVLDSKMGESSSAQHQNSSVAKQRLENDSSLSGLGGEIDLAILNYALTGETPQGSPEPQSCNDLSGAQKKNCLAKVKQINDQIRKHIEKTNLKDE